MSWKKKKSRIYYKMEKGRSLLNEDRHSGQNWEKNKTGSPFKNSQPPSVFVLMILVLIYISQVSERQTPGWALPSSSTLSSPDWAKLDGRSGMWAGLDEAVPGCVWEKNPGRQLDLFLRDLGRETPTVFPPLTLPGQERSANMRKRVFTDVCLVEQERKKQMLFIADHQVGLASKCCDTGQTSRRILWRHRKLRCTYTLLISGFVFFFIYGSEISNKMLSNISLFNLQNLNCSWPWAKEHTVNYDKVSDSGGTLTFALPRILDHKATYVMFVLPLPICI